MIGAGSQRQDRCGFAFCDPSLGRVTKRKQTVPRARRAGWPLGKADAAAVVEGGGLRPCDVPDIALRVTPAEAAAPERLARFLQQLGARNVPQRLVGPLHPVVRAEVDADRRSPELLRRRAELGLVVGRRVQRSTSRHASVISPTRFGSFTTSLRPSCRRHRCRRPASGPGRTRRPSPRGRARAPSTPRAPAPRAGARRAPAGRGARPSPPP